MYNYARAYVKKDNHWDTEDVSNVTLQSLLSTYQNVRIIATFDTETAERGIDFKNNRTALSIADKSETVTDWLASLSEDTVVIDNTKVTFSEVQSVKHWNLYDLPVKVSGANAKFGEGQPIPNGMKTDLKIVSEVPEPQELSTKNIANNMLIALNGRVCKMSLIDGNAYAIDAYNKTVDGSNILSAIDFTDVGGLKQVDILEEMVTPIAQNADDVAMNRQRVVIDIGEAVPGSTPILILDGYLHILDGSYKRLGGTKLRVDINLTVAKQRASKHKQFNHDYIDSANLDYEGVDGSTFDVVKFMHQTDTFFAFVLTEDLCIFRERLTDTGTWGGYEHYRAPKGIIVSENFEYMPHTFEEVSAEHLSISVGDNEKNWAFWNTVNFNHNSKFGANAHTWPKTEFKKAYAFEMYTF